MFQCEHSCVKTVDAALSIKVFVSVQNLHVCLELLTFTYFHKCLTFNITIFGNTTLHSILKYPLYSIDLAAGTGQLACEFSG